MMPSKPLPYNGDFASPDEYVSSLLHFVYTTDIFQILCGGTHILDFFTSRPGLFHTVLPLEWHAFLLQCDIMRLLNIFMRDDLSNLNLDGLPELPSSLYKYIKSIRDLSLSREYTPSKEVLPVLPQTVRVGMKPKKIHEVKNFADYIDRLSENIYQENNGEKITHYVDFGSGQNYLGRALASEPYNRHVVAVEGRENNVTAARGLDITSGLAIKEKVMRNKKLWNKILEAGGPNPHDNPDALVDTVKKVAGSEGFDFRPREQLTSDIAIQEGKGYVQYVSGRLDSGDLSDVVAKIDGGYKSSSSQAKEQRKLKLMAISIHSCGNLSHYAIRSLTLNPDIRAIAIVGCCYNLMTEKLGPPSYKHAYLRPTLQALNGRVGRESSRFDPQGFPMSRQFSTYKDDGIRLNITARMMACQAPRNWGRLDSEAFFSRHFYRAVLQKIFLDRGVVKIIHHGQSEDASSSSTTAVDETAPAPGPFEMSTQPVTIGGLRKQCYSSLKAYIRGCIEKLTTSTEYRRYADVMNEKMKDITDEEIDAYEAEFLPRKKELCVIWSLMAFSAMVVESLIVTDRWMFLREQDEVKSAWVETVFDYAESPRNLVVVGVKREDGGDERVTTN
ncbi:hypothetical protein QQS21_004338 [Conoideocrella luteorostrata]|uniref:Methyltransferase domain-containing protein n=1 Tax=Conoideocrella luteorostrata TaxID=1105319 RepID=A0AAJ0G1N1_9HYPO|nr:hypothetical protein QQS21_004338 [Conoideocrella luteorostrata]